MKNTSRRISFKNALPLLLTLKIMVWLIRKIEKIDKQLKKRGAGKPKILKLKYKQNDSICLLRVLSEAAYRDQHKSMPKTYIIAITNVENSRNYDR